MRAILEVLRAGLHTTVQDGGRWGYQDIGVPPGGALDLPALRRANVLVGNAPQEAAVEITVGPCVLRPNADVRVAVTGARAVLTAAGQTVAPDTALALRAGDLLEVGARLSGARTYVSVRGGVDAPVVLGSRSAWPMSPRRGALADGTRLPIGTRARGPWREGTWPSPLTRGVLRVLPAPGAGEDEARALGVLCAGPYRIASSATRMAYPLEGPHVALAAPGRPSSGTVTGALQILPSGRPVLLMADRQTTGGYPIAAVVITADHAHAAQLAAGEEVRFERCTRHDALQALLRDEQAWQRW